MKTLITDGAGFVGSHSVEYYTKKGIPWYLKGEILEDNEIIYAKDEDKLDFWLYKRLKIWNGMKRRQHLVSATDLIARARSKWVGKRL
jgi:dTDP-D-glucose 4,6-dehydratase